jgi:hypothetical protein
MDPQACWKRLCEALRDNDVEEAYWAAGDLRNWISAGGYRPAGVPGVAELSAFRIFLLKARKALDLPAYS